MAHRIIPALAGNTAAKPSTASSSSDHPRSRGEYHGAGYDFGSWAGSSPLSRGILDPVDPRDVGGRIIPALAGNTRSFAMP